MTFKIIVVAQCRTCRANARKILRDRRAGFAHAYGRGCAENAMRVEHLTDIIPNFLDIQPQTKIWEYECDPVIYIYIYRCSESIKQPYNNIVVGLRVIFGWALSSF